MDEMNRRQAMQHLLAIPAGLAITPDLLDRASAHAHEALEQQGAAAAPATQGARPAAQTRPYEPKQFTTDEWRLLRVLVDYIIPRDARSGSATQAGVPEFMDFMLGENAGMRTWMKNGLTWINAESRKRFGKGFISATDAQRRELLDAIAYPKRAAADVQAGVQFFTNLRNLTSSGFWSSRMGVADLGYLGNRPVASWQGTPPNVMRWLEGK